MCRSSAHSLPNAILADIATVDQQIHPNQTLDCFAHEQISAEACGP